MDSEQQCKKHCLCVHWIHLGIGFGFSEFNLKIKDLCRLLLQLSVGFLLAHQLPVHLLFHTHTHTQKLCDVHFTNTVVCKVAILSSINVLWFML